MENKVEWHYWQKMTSDKDKGKISRKFIEIVSKYLKK